MNRPTRRLPAAAALAGALLAAVAPSRGAEIACADGNGRVVALSREGELIPLETDVRVALPNWSRFGCMAPWSAERVTYAAEDGRRRWTGFIPARPGAFARYDQSIIESNGLAHVRISVTAEEDLDLEGVFLFIRLPVSAFAGLPCTLETSGRAVAGADLPRAPPEAPPFLSGTADRVTVGARKDKRIVLRFDRQRRITVQDNRAWNDAGYAIFTALTNGPLRRGRSVEAAFALAVAGRPDRAPARLSMNPDAFRYRLEGFGGNFVYGIESPVTAYTLDRLRAARARTEMLLEEWEPANDDASPTNMNWSAFESRDRPGSPLRRRFLLDREICRRGIRSCVSIWRLPEWLYEEPGAGAEAHRRRVASERWPELVESVASYLLYARRAYGVEPELFSFNESDQGVYVLMTPEEHRDAILRFGARFEELGLKTRLLLGDVADPRGSLPFTAPAAADREAMRYVGALAFHSWGGGTPAEYRAWADAARARDLPLLVTELGFDAAAWRTPAYIRTFYYALQELRMIQELLLHARPQALLQWEFTGDYGMVAVEPADGRGPAPVLTPTLRFWFLRHFCNLTPPGAHALATVSDREQVLFTAFRGDAPEAQDGPAYTLHIANLGAARPATVSGLPRNIGQLRAARSGETEGFAVLPDLRVRGGRARIDLTANSLLTLTTMPVE
ncbi:MAG: hypothetical protein FJ225_05710 [Lentisphaerae bacterium]|nr:hypothetical protein [Lentisphaerota bacterium]